MHFDWSLSGKVVVGFSHGRQETGNAVSGD